MAKYRKKPVIIEAYHIKDLSYESVKECLEFMGQQVKTHKGFVVEQPFDNYMQIVCKTGGINIETLEGTMLANEGDYIIKGVSGELYPCKPDIFEKTYELLEVE